MELFLGKYPLIKHKLNQNSDIYFECLTTLTVVMSLKDAIGHLLVMYINLIVNICVKYNTIHHSGIKFVLEIISIIVIYFYIDII